MGYQTHKEAYPRIFVLELDKEIKVAAKLEQIDGLGLYQRLPRGWIEEVQMMELCSAISLIIMAPVLDRWAWTLDDSRISLDKPPTRMNLDVREFDVSSILCPICDSQVDFVSTMARLGYKSSAKEDAKVYFGGFVFFALVACVGS
nr:hypothetical protein [Tanacetum cinerariifolium]